MKDYDNYAQWKKWNSDEENSRLLARINDTFPKLLRCARVGEEASLLEIGFGNCYFMDWARNNGHSVVGVEIIASLVGLAVGKGHHAMAGTLEECAPNLAPNFDAIIALDVFEHMDLEEVKRTLVVASGLLRPDGVVIMRTPNGGSPFGLMLQNGDYTHKAAFTKTKMQQICLETEFEVEWAGNPPRSFAGATSVLKRRLAYWLRDLFEVIFGMAYFGARSPMDPSIVFVLRRKIPKS